MSESRIPSLDGFRALSIISVVVAHLPVTSYFPEGRGIRLWGPVGVRIFFVISGFIITTLLLREEEKRGSVSLKNFYIRRAFRILPVFWFFVAAVAVADWALTMHLKPQWYVMALTFTAGATQSSVNSVLGHTWSLAVEEQFYLLWPLVFVFCGIRGRYRFLFGVLMIMPLSRYLIYRFGRQSLEPFTSLGQFDLLMYGSGLALAMQSSRERVRQIVEFRPAIMRTAAWLLLAVVAVSWKPLGNAQLWVLRSFVYSFQGISIIYLVASYTLVRRGVSYQLLNWRPVVSIGLWSYSMYLWQQLLLVHGQASEHEVWWREFPNNLLLVVPVAALSYYCIETPFLRLRKRLVPEA
jgi:peptidoglycan/LPS O-acetylase OafA/YrhL